MAKPGKGLIVTSRREIVTTAMNLLTAQSQDPALVEAAEQQAKGLFKEVSELDQAISTKAMDPDQLADLSAFLVILDRQLSAWKGQAATLGSKELKDTFEEAGSSLRSFVRRLNAVDSAFAGVYEGMAKGNG